MSANSVSQDLADKLNELYHITTEIETKTKKKRELKDEIMVLVKRDKMEARKFAIADRYIKYNLSKQTGGLTQKLLLGALSEYYGPSKKEEAIKVYKYILSKRDSKMKEDIDIGRR